MSNIIIYFIRKTGLLPYFYHFINNHFQSFNSLNPDNLNGLKLAFKSAPFGDYYEFGLYKGFSFWFAMQVSEIMNINNIHFYGFDSFDGLPTPKGIDQIATASGQTYARGNFCAGIDLVNNLLIKYGAKKNSYTLIKGFYNEVLNDKLFNRYNFKKASVILIDCDLYDSTKRVLNFIPRLLQNNTIILFDDWNLTGKDKGQQLAFNEWRKKNRNFTFKESCRFGIGRGFKVSVSV